MTDRYNPKLKEGILRTIRDVGHNLEGTATFLGLLHYPIHLSKIPEYQQALNAIERLEMALHDKIDLLNKKHKDD